MPERDMEILRHILRYCDEVELAMQRFGDDRAVFMHDPVYRNAVSMPIQQIGELSKHLTDAFIAAQPNIPWKQIKGMRTWFAHQYWGMDLDVIWEVMHDNIPELKAFCMRMLNP